MFEKCCRCGCDLEDEDKMFGACSDCIDFADANPEELLKEWSEGRFYDDERVESKNRGGGVA